MNIAMSGATGFVGTNLTEAFQKRGWKVIPLTREDFKLGDDDLSRKLDGVQIVVNLAGAPVGVRWTEEYKKILYSSRIDTTRKIVSTLGKMEKRPRLFVSTSAIGIYDTKGRYTEADRNYANDFLGRLALDWEQIALSSKNLGIRTVIFRFGIVLGRNGGALQKMLVPFKLGLGGVIGDGRQPFSWVHIEDIISAYFTVIEDEGHEGIYNLTSPNPTTNEGLAKALGHALHRPTLLRVPLFVLKLQFGEAAKVISEGQYVLPKRLLESGFTFKFTRIDEAIEDLIEH